MCIPGLKNPYLLAHPVYRRGGTTSGAYLEGKEAMKHKKEMSYLYLVV